MAETPEVLCGHSLPIQTGWASFGMSEAGVWGCFLQEYQVSRQLKIYDAHKDAVKVPTCPPPVHKQ